MAKAIGFAIAWLCSTVPYHKSRPQAALVVYHLIEALEEVEEDPVELVGFLHVDHVGHAWHYLQAGAYHAFGELAHGSHCSRDVEVSDDNECGHLDLIE